MLFEKNQYRAMAVDERILENFCIHKTDADAERTFQQTIDQLDLCRERYFGFSGHSGKISY